MDPREIRNQASATGCQITKLPNEIILMMYESLHSISDAMAVSITCHHFHNTYQSRLSMILETIQQRETISYDWAHRLAKAQCPDGTPFQIAKVVHWNAQDVELVVKETAPHFIPYALGRLLPVVETRPFLPHELERLVESWYSLKLLESCQLPSDHKNRNVNLEINKRWIDQLVPGSLAQSSVKAKAMWDLISFLWKEMDPPLSRRLRIMPTRCQSKYYSPQDRRYLLTPAWKHIRDIALLMIGDMGALVLNLWLKLYGPCEIDLNVQDVLTERAGRRLWELTRRDEKKESRGRFV